MKNKKTQKAKRKPNKDALCYEYPGNEVTKLIQDALKDDLAASLKEIRQDEKLVTEMAYSIFQEDVPEDYRDFVDCIDSDEE